VKRCPICGRPLDVGQVTALVDTDDLDLLALDLAAPVLVVAIGDTAEYVACVHATERELPLP
jgi:hypothetical protein